ncbi:oligopeptide/dipeptide ABC transporter ATP-binding protein [Amycolatopsis echigonensis]|uniref:Peptide/nickel transport system ATP-binding protein n=1 Tax=Amycolatopsis echigonensis TaxID=2576905 RepID=A0A2N3WNQ8_9PSEU|nr:peptide/nickel transport system ATP-binding protein [Amycolatopsis niigatensis]
MTEIPVLDVRNVHVEFRRRRRAPVFRALDDVSLVIPRGKTVGLVGESGSGKSTLAKAVLGLVPVQSGSVHLLGREITHIGTAERRKLGRVLQAVFQDPNSSLNPSYTVARSLAEPLRAQGTRSRAELAKRSAAMLEDVGLDPAAAARYPRDFSGGQRQRISIARALMTAPQLVIADESVSALDLSVQAQILNLLADLQDQHGLSYLFISHDISVVKHICHDVTVLYRGQVMESGPTGPVTDQPAHPYTRALLLAAPVADPVAQRRRRATQGALSSTTGTAASNGCPFAARCPFATDQCRQVRPEPRPLADGRVVACHRYPDWQHEAAASTPATSLVTSH